MVHVLEQCNVVPHQVIKIHRVIKKEVLKQFYRYVQQHIKIGELYLNNVIFLDLAEFERGTKIQAGRYSTASVHHQVISA